MRYLLGVPIAFRGTGMASSVGALKLGVAACATGAMLLAGATTANARGGTAKPPTSPPPAAGVPLVTVLPPAGPVLTPPVPASTANGFSISGFVQAATVTGGCPVPASAPGTNRSGGTVTLNGIIITIPTNVIVQFPANTLTWADAVCARPPAPTYALGFDGSAGVATAAVVSPGQQAGPILSVVEMRVDGNIVGASGHVGALVYASQHSANSGSGYISSIDYNDGSIYVAAGPVPAGAGAVAPVVRLLINDPSGRYGRAQTNTDVRFSVDDANPTIKAAATGYPMCVPRVTPTPAIPAAGGLPAVPAVDDASCPQKNRPLFASGCRTFASTPIPTPIGGDIVPVSTGPGGYCSAFVMKALPNMPGSVALGGPAAGANIAVVDVAGDTVGEPDARKQAPFEVGDFITWAGTLVRGGDALAPVAALGTTTGDVIWVHTIDANVGIYTQPRTLPAYISVGEFVVGVDPLPTGAAVVAGAETTARFSLEASTSDVGSVLDVYWDDKGYRLPVGAPAGPIVSTANSEYFRWVTPESMTGTLTFQSTAKGGVLPATAISAQPFGGGITTQFDGPQPGRARIRATRVPPISTAAGLGCGQAGGSQGCAVTQSPTRYLRAVLRSLCAPAQNNPAGGALILGNLDNGQFYDINIGRPDLPGVETVTGKAPGNTCLESAQFANGLFTGQYMAPVGEFIFGENTLAGSRIIPANVWQLDFLVKGEGGLSGASAAGLAAPRPY